jgi:aryl-alcohol dehydrogenase-like predicted oxidoreductase
MSSNNNTTDNNNTNKRLKQSEHDNNDITINPSFITLLDGTIPVRAIGFGTLPATVLYPTPESTPNQNSFLEMLSCISKLGTGNACMFIDIADTYSPDPIQNPNYAEHMMNQVLNKDDSIHDKIVIGTKGGMERISRESTGWRPLPFTKETLIPSVQRSLEILKANSANNGLVLLPKRIIWSLHHCPSNTPVTAQEDFIKVIDGIAKTLKNEEKKLVVQDVANNSTIINNPKLMLGICNATPTHIRLSAAANVRVIQNEYSFWVRDAEMDFVQEMSSTTTTTITTSSSSSSTPSNSKRGTMRSIRNIKGAIFVAHSVFGGLKTRRGERDLLKVFPQLIQVASQRNSNNSNKSNTNSQPTCTPYQIYLMYLLKRGERIMGSVGKMILLVGGRMLNHVMEDLLAIEIVGELTENEVVVLDKGWNV